MGNFARENAWFFVKWGIFHQKMRDFLVKSPAGRGGVPPGRSPSTGRGTNSVAAQAPTRSHRRTFWKRRARARPQKRRFVPPTARRDQSAAAQPDAQPVGSAPRSAARLRRGEGGRAVGRSAPRAARWGRVVPRGNPVSPTAPRNRQRSPTFCSPSPPTCLLVLDLTAGRHRRAGSPQPHPGKDLPFGVLP